MKGVRLALLVYLLLSGETLAQTKLKNNNLKVGFIGLEKGKDHYGLYIMGVPSIYKKWGFMLGFQTTLGVPVRPTSNFYYFPRKSVESTLNSTYQGKVKNIKSLNFYLLRPVYIKQFLAIHVLGGLCLQDSREWLKFYDKEKEVGKEGVYYLMGDSKNTLPVAFGVSFHIKYFNMILSYQVGGLKWSLGFGLGSDLHPIY